MPEIPENFAPFVDFALNVVQALVFLVVGWFVAGRIAAFVRNRVTGTQRLDQTLGLFVANMVRYVLLIAVIIAVLQTFGFQVTSLVAVLGAATLAVGLSLQGTLAHFAAGVMIVLFRPYKLGDFIQVGDTMGTVIDINLFMTELNSIDNARIYVPNGEAWGKTLINHSVNPVRRCDITFSIDYGDDIDKAIGIIRSTITADERFLNEPAEPWVQVIGLGESSVDIQMRAWCRAENLWEAKFATTKAVKQAFDAAGVSIPFPHRVIISQEAA